MSDFKVYKGKDFINKVARFVKDSRMIGEDFVLFDENMLSIPLSELFITDYFIVVQVLEGRETLYVNMKPYSVEGPCMLMMLPGETISVEAPDGLPKQRGIAFSEKVLSNHFGNPKKYFNLYNFLLANPVLPLDKASQEGLDRYVSDIHFIAEGSAVANRQMCALYLTNAFIFGTLEYLCTAQAVRLGTVSGKRDRDSLPVSRITSEFMNLVQTHYADWRKLENYANALCISERYLYTVIKKHTGHTASYWLDYYVMAEAERLLVTTNLSVQEVCFKLNFNSQSDFSKFFKRLSGMTPSKYRLKSRPRI